MKKYQNKKKLQYRRKTIIISALSLLLIISSVFIFSFMQNDSFGNLISFNKEERITSNATNKIHHRPNFVTLDVKLQKRAKNPASNNVAGGGKYVSLTFDDGPGWNSTQRILDVLKKYNVKATWFVLGSRAEQNPQMLKQIANAGHEVANHSYSHANLANLALEGAMSEINSTQKIVKNIIGKAPLYLRPPYGSYNAAIENTAGIGIALWNVDSLDWQLKNGVAAYNQVMSTLRSNPVILFHDIYESSADAIDLLVPKLVEQGYTFVTYSEHQKLGN